VIFLAVYFCCEADVTMVYLSAFFHELAHFAVGHSLGVMVHGIRIGIAGMCLDTGYISEPEKKILISVAGPLVSFGVFMVAAVLAVVIKTEAWLYRFAFLNFCIAAVNMLPIIPLDGGAVMKAVLIRRLGMIRGQNISRKISLGILSLVAMSGVWFMCRGYISISFGVVILFLIASVRKENIMCSLEKQTELFSTNAGNGKMRYISTDSDTCLLRLLSDVSCDSCVVAVFERGRFIGELSREEIICYSGSFGVMHTARDCLKCKHTHMQNKQ